MSSLQRFRGKRGQGMTEYIIVIAIVAIGAILIIGLFGKQIKHAFRRIGSAVDGTPVGVDAGIDTEMETEADKQDAMNTFDANAGDGQL